MPYGDENTGLMALLAASQAGLEPSIAYGEMQRIQAEQQAQQAQRQERTSGLLGMLQEMAMGGMPYAGAEAMLEAAPGPMGPALQSGLQSLYPSGGTEYTSNIGLNDIEGMVRDLDTGGLVRESTVDPSAVARGPQARQYGTGAEALSPAFVPPEPEVPSPTEQIAVANFEQQAEIDADLTAATQEAAKARKDGWTVDQWITKIQRTNPELFAVANDELMAIAESMFGSAAVDMRGLPEQG